MAAGLGLLAALAIMPVRPAAAADSPIVTSFSGFMTVGAGKVLSGTQDQAVNQGYNCPCYVSDFAQGGVYESGGVRLGPDSRIGLQMRIATQDDRFGLVGQGVARGAAGGKGSLEWLYGTARIDSRFTLQVGRKRLPLFAYSEFQDVGQAIPWGRLPGQLYGWEAVNYNGANLRFEDTFGDWLATVNVFGGSETVRDSGFWKIYNGKDSRTDARWGKIAGIEAKIAEGGFEARYVYIQSNTQNRLVSDGESDYSSPAKQRIHGISLGFDRGPWIARTEMQYIDRKADYGTDRGVLVALGYRIGDFTPFVSHARYRQRTHPGFFPAEGHDTTSFVLRYDVNASSAVKLQFDLWRDRSAAGFESMHGNARMLMLSYDLVF